MSYLHHQHAVGYQRLSAMMDELFGLPISQGAIANALYRGTPALTVTDLAIRDRLRQASVIGCGETGARLTTKSAWHQIRLAHVLRDVQYALDAGETVFAGKLRDLLRWTIAVGRRRLARKPATLAQYRQKADRKLDRLLALPLVTPQGEQLRAQTMRWRGHFFVFMTNSDVPPTNNGSERALRPSVIFRKVTNGFRSEWGAQTHASIRSAIGTGRLHGLSAFQAIQRALYGGSVFAIRPTP